MSGAQKPESSRPIRVLHVIPAVAPRYGGPSTNLWPMTSAVAATGTSVEIATTTADGPKQLTETDLPADRVKTHLFPNANELKHWLRLHAKDYDLLHIHSLWNRVVAVGCSESRRAKVPYIIRPCGMLSQYTWARSRLKKYLYWWLVERRNARGAAGFHATSDVEQNDIRACGLLAPVEVMPLGVEPSALDKPVRSDWLRQLCGHRSASKPIILFLSRLHPKKGVVDYLLPAFAKLKTDSFLAIAGGVDDSTPGYGEEIKATAERLNITDRVALLGPVSPSDRWSAFDGAAVFCLPSQSENFGIVVAEAMARGCPVVASEGVDAVQHVVAAGAGIKVPLEVDALASALDHVLASPGQMGEAGKSYVRDKLAWKPIGEQITRLYGRIFGVSK